MNTVGIDFGTTKTLVAAVDERSGKPVPISLGRAGYELPTTVYVDASHQILFGEDADDHLVLDSRNYLPRIKRDLGTAREHVLNGRRFTPVDLASEFLRHIKERVESEHFHGKIDHAVITVPAKYGPAARGDLETAVKSAGFSSFELLDEPIAAGIAFLDEKGESELGNEILVFDWGGGTLDIAMVERRNGAWNLNHDLVEGDAQLGGEDINDSILDAVNRWLKSAGHPSIGPQNQPDHSNLSKEIVKMKRLLSKKDSHTLRLHTANCPIEFPCSLGEFEEFIQMELDQAFQCLAKWEQKARNAGKAAGNVLLVGGTSQIPAVARRLEQTGMRPIRWTEGMRAVALGAALHARLASAGGPTKSDPKFSAMQEYRRLLEAVRSGKALGQEECLRLRQEAAALALTETEALAMEMQIIGKPLPATGHRPNTSPRQKPVSGSVDVSFAKPEYGMFIRISDRSSATAPNAFESTHFPFGYDVLITNNSSQPVTHVSVRITRAGIPGSETNVVARILDPDERVRLTMLDLDWYLQAGDVVEVNWNGAATPLWRAVEEADCGPSELPILPIAATWSKGAFSGKVLQIWCLEGGGMGALTVQTQAGGKATLASVPYGRWLPVGWMEFSDSKNIADSDVIEFSSPGFSPAIGIIVP